MVICGKWIGGYPKDDIMENQRPSFSTFFPKYGDMWKILPYYRA
jgi:hypothetical protein